MIERLGFKESENKSDKWQSCWLKLKMIVMLYQVAADARFIFSTATKCITIARRHVSVIDDSVTLPLCRLCTLTERMHWHWQTDAAIQRPTHTSSSSAGILIFP